MMNKLLVLALAGVCFAGCEDEIVPIECAPPVDGTCEPGCGEVNSLIFTVEGEACEAANHVLGCVDERLRRRFVEVPVTYLHPDTPDLAYIQKGRFFEWFDLQGRDLGYCIGDDGRDLVIRARESDFCRDAYDEFYQRCWE